MCEVRVTLCTNDFSTNFRAMIFISSMNKHMLSEAIFVCK